MKIKTEFYFPSLVILKYPYPKLRVSPNSLFSKVLFPLIDRLPRGRKPKKSWRTEMRFARRWSFKGGGSMKDQYALAKVVRTFLLTKLVPNRLHVVSKDLRWMHQVCRNEASCFTWKKGMTPNWSQAESCWFVRKVISYRTPGSCWANIPGVFAN